MKKKPVECHSLVLTDIEGMSVKFGYTVVYLQFLACT